MTAERDGESFLGRWSRRKLEGRTVELETAESSRAQGAVANAADSGDAAAAPVDEPAVGQVGTSGQDAADPKRMLTEEDFADVDFATLDATSDYTRFLSGNVPDVIRRKALARLWTSDPLFAGADPIHDYHGDFTDAAVAVTEGLKTAYRVGKGFLTDDEVAVWEKLGKPEPTSDVELAGSAPKRRGPGCGHAIGNTRTGSARCRGLRSANRPSPRNLGPKFTKLPATPQAARPDGR